jgi:LacI family transcriptional regulator
MAEKSPRPPKVTLRSLAKELEISPATVMRALNNHPNVTQGIRRKVIALAMKRNYQLPEHYSRQVAIVITDATFDGYTGQLLNALSAELRKRDIGFEIVISKNVEFIHEHSYSGVISTVWESGLEKFWPREHNLPLVALNAAPNIIEGIYQVASDEKQGISMGMEYLVSKGKKRIAFVSTPLKNNPNAQERVDAFLDFCRSHNLEESFHEEHTVENTLENIAGNIIARQADAVFASSETYAFPIMHYLRQKNISIPGDIGMLSLELPLFSAYAAPPLTTISQDFPKLAFYAVETLLKRIKQLPCKQKVSVPYNFTERESI